MLLNLDFFYQFLTPVLKNYRNASLLDPFFNLLASSTDGYLLKEYENYLEHSISQLLPGSFDWVKKVTLSSTDLNQFVIVQTGSEFQSNPTWPLPFVVSSSVNDSALSAFKFGIWPLFAPILISEDLQQIYYAGAPGSFLNDALQSANVIPLFFGTVPTKHILDYNTNYTISPTGFVQINTSTSSDFYFAQIGPLSVTYLTFFNNPPPQSVVVAENITGTAFITASSSSIIVPGFSKSIPSGTYFIYYSSVWSFPTSYYVLSSTLNSDGSTTLWFSSLPYSNGEVVSFTLQTNLQNFYIINGRYQNMKIWSKLGQTILDQMIPLFSDNMFETMLVLFDTWMSPFFAEVVQRIIQEPASNYWLTRAVHLVFGLPLCSEDNSVVLTNPIINDVFGYKVAIIPCSSTSGIKFYYGLAGAPGVDMILSPTVVSGTVLNKYDTFYSQVYVTDYIEKGEFLTQLLVNNPSAFERYMITPDLNLQYMVNLLQRRIAAVVVDPAIPNLFPNYIDRINYIFRKRFPAGFGYVVVNYTPTLGPDTVSGSDFLYAMYSVGDLTQTYNFNISCLVSANTPGLGIDEDVFTVHKDFALFSSTSGFIAA